MNDWRHIGRLFAAHFSRVITTLASVLLTLAFIVGTGAVVAYAYVDRLAANAGITDWSIEIGKLSREHVRLNTLSLTLDTLPEPSDDSAAVPLATLSTLLSTQLPSWLPERIEIDSLRINGAAVAAIGDIQAGLQWTHQQQNAALTVTAIHPEHASIVAQRRDNQLKISVNHRLADATLNYNYRSGELNSTGHISLPTTQAGTGAMPVTVSGTQLQLSVSGMLPPNTRPDSPETLLAQLSARTEVKLAKAASLTTQVLNDKTLATQLTGSASVDIKQGVIRAYQFNAQGQLTDWPKINTLLPSSIPSPQQVRWQIDSDDTLSLPLLAYPQLMDKTHWYANVDIQLDGDEIQRLTLSAATEIQQRNGVFQSLRLKPLHITADRLTTDVGQQTVVVRGLNLQSTLTLSPEAAVIEHTDDFSAQLTTDIGDFNIISDKLTANVNINNIDAAETEFDLTINSNRIILDPLSDFPLTIALSGHYAQQQLITQGTATIANELTIEHDTKIADLRQVTTQLNAQFEWPSAPAAQNRWQNLLQAYAPLLTLNKGSFSGSGLLQADLISTQDWSLTDAQLTVDGVDLIYDTLALADGNITATLNADRSGLEVADGQVDIGSLQQGFAIGPIHAALNAELPWSAPGEGSITLATHQLNAFGGSVTFPEQTYSLNQRLLIPVVFERIDLGELMRQYPSDRIDIDGKVSGTLPLVWDSKQLTLDKGYLSAVAPGGHLAVDSSALRSAVGSNPSLQTLASVLENFYYDELSSEVDYDNDGNVILGLTLRGYNPQLEDGRAVNLNIRLEEDLAALIKGLQLSNSVSDTIRKRIQQKVN